MAKNQFIAKFESKSDAELESIAMNSRSFVFEARYAAITLLKNRNYKATIIEQVELEAEKRSKAKNEQIASLNKQDHQLITRIRQIPIKGTWKYRLENGNELQVKRWNENTFQVRIEDNYRSSLAPVIICNVKADSTYFCYPFFYIKSILTYGVGLTVLTTVLFFLGYFGSDKFVLLFPILGSVGLQLILMPFIYFITLNFFKKRLGNR
ncbi:hypothetical protein [Pedobacter helvus]|uniref:Uncharacterized protein n=1 Tax=Pedobacter helvus TaxID=2563444 RepID=A0ABW9JKQ4_9SPHI|nr:hypothetical protein [Pedobacter ureilyticus]